MRLISSWINIFLVERNSLKDTVQLKKIKSNAFLSLSDIVLKNKNKFAIEKFDKDIDQTTHAYRSYPKKIILCDLVDAYSVDSETLDFTRSFQKTIEDQNSVMCNIFAYYPPGGIIDWHTNENIPHWNAICTFSADGNSFFEYLQNKKPVKIYDEKGWSVKMIKWTNKEPLVWHRAVSNTDRITVTFSSINKHDVEQFVKKIT